MVSSLYHQPRPGGMIELVALVDMAVSVYSHASNCTIKGTHDLLQIRNTFPLLDFPSLKLEPRTLLLLFSFLVINLTIWEPSLEQIRAVFLTVAVLQAYRPAIRIWLFTIVIARFSIIPTICI